MPKILRSNERFGLQTTPILLPSFLFSEEKEKYFVALYPKLFLVFKDIYRAMSSQRQTKYARQIQKDLAEIFQKDPRYFFFSAMGTITHLSVSADLSLAKIYLSIFPIHQAEAVFEHLNEIKGEIRFKLGQKIRRRARIVPELAFFHDDIDEKASKLDRLIDTLHISPKKEK